MCVAEEEEGDDHIRGNFVGGEDERPAPRCPSEQVGGREMVECVGEGEENGEGCLPQVGMFMRTNTEATLVDGDDESQELAVKGLKCGSVEDEFVMIGSVVD